MSDVAAVLDCYTGDGALAPGLPTVRGPEARGMVKQFLAVGFESARMTDGHHQMTSDATSFLPITSRSEERIPGVKWYCTVLNQAPQRDASEVPRPDALAVMHFENQEAFEKLPDTPERREALKDNVGFISHFDTYPVERVILIAEEIVSS